MNSEILTFQFGHYSNFIGTHWWNIQESGFQYDPDNPSEINHDVLFREGLTLQNEVTFTPRLLLVDLKGSLKTLSEHGELYDLPYENNDINAEIVQTEPKEEKISFQQDLEASDTTKKIYDLDKEVRVWSDFLYSRFHPRTVNMVKEYQHSNEHTPFDIFPIGTNLWKNQQFSEDFADKIRNYVEECDSFQGFQILTDSNDGFSGLSTACLQYLNDEYDTKPVLSFPVDPDPNSKDPINILNSALCYDALSEHSSLFVPLSTQSRQFEFITPKPELFYHTSAVIAAALDTFSLNYRLKNSKHSLADLCTDLSINGRKAAAASICFPFPLKKGEDFIDCLNNWEGPLWQSLTPNCHIKSEENLQLLVLRGIQENRLKRPLQVPTEQREFPAYRCENLKEMLSYYLACTCYGSRSAVTISREAMSVKTPFPGFFDSRVGNNGDIDSDQSAKVDVDSVSVLSGLHSGKFVGNIFDELSKNLEKIKYKRFHRFDSEGFESDQFKECFDRILDLKDCYEDSYLI